MPKALSFHRRAERPRALNSFPPDRLPDNIPLLYYAYHIMVGLGTILIGVMALAAFASGAARSFPRPFSGY